jgi:hypothetical protein
VASEPRLDRADHQFCVADGRFGFLQRDVDGRIVRLVPAFEERSEKPPARLVELTTADQKVDERGDDPRVLGSRLAKGKQRRLCREERRV